METFYSILCGLPLSPWFSACAQGDWQAAQDLLHRCPMLLKGRGPLGYTALHYAAEQGDTQACRFLLQQGADLLVPDVLGEYPPSKAIQKGAEDTAAFLDSYAHQQDAGKGLDWGWVWWLSENVWKSCLWFESCQSGDWATVKRLFERGADIGAQGPWENTALHYAAEQGNIEACCFLLQNGGDLLSQNLCGKTPMHLAAENGRKEALRLLIARNTAELPEGFYCTAPLRAVIGPWSNSFWRQACP